MFVEIKMGEDLYLFADTSRDLDWKKGMTMKNYEKPVVELVSFQAEEIMDQVDTFALYGHLGFSDVNTAAIWFLKGKF